MTFESNKRKRIRDLVLLLVGLVAICVAVASITSMLLNRGSEWRHDDAGHGHEWLHEQLDLSPAEVTALDALEPDYRRERAALKNQFQAKSAKLREQIANSDEFNENVRQTIHELHLIHGSLQELSIRHYYDMMQALPPEKRAKLKEMAEEALSIPE